jgi:hypothetical protein
MTQDTYIKLQKAKNISVAIAFIFAWLLIVFAGVTFLLKALEIF